MPADGRGLARAARLSGLPENARKSGLVADADALQRLVSGKAAPDAVSAAAGRLRRDIVAAYASRVAPRTPPQLERAGELTPASAFAASLVILLREGLEAILVLAAIIALVLKTGRRDALAWVHAGWIAALALGALTWVAATCAVAISGANRELTEGATALVAAAMLLYVGYRLHGKSYAGARTRFIKQQVGQALAGRTLRAVAALSFVAVYREMFEIVHFYQTLWIQAGGAGRHAVLGGIAALQEGGALGVRSLHFDPWPLLGVYPGVEALGSQLVVLVAAGLLAARRRARVS